jgi:multidrug efflux pump subunit AcrA (membrane-fusion protein)
MNLKLNSAIALAVFASAISLAHEHGENCAHAHDRREAEHHHTKHLHVSKAVQEAMGLKTIKAEHRKISRTKSFVGRFELVPDARKVVSTPVAGRLSLLVKTLDQVRKGDVIFTITSPELVARRHEISALEKRIEVYRQIKTPNAALENELAVKRAEREAMLAGAEEENGIVKVCAQTDGMVESLIARDGAYLEIGSSAIQLVRRRHLRFKALVSASEARQLKDDATATVAAHQGKIRIGVGDDTGMVPVYVIFDSDINAIPGQRAYAEYESGKSEKPHLAVPSKCIVTIGLQPTVFVRDDHNPEQFAAVAVTPGASGGGWTAVEGLNDHRCEVVSDGVYELKLALPSDNNEQKSAGHFHADGTFHEGEH